MWQMCVESKRKQTGARLNKASSVTEGLRISSKFSRKLSEALNRGVSYARKRLFWPLPGKWIFFVGAGGSASKSRNRKHINGAGAVTQIRAWMAAWARLAR